MVQITLHPANHANHSGRFFPSSGYLGLTKVQVSGIIRTRIEDDHKLLPAHRLTISIKCYELRSRLHHSRCNVLVDVTDTLWTPPDDSPIGDIGDLDLPFRITLPTDTAGYSTLQFPDYKIFWRIEAAIEHPQQFGLGSRLSRVFDLDLTRYDVQNPLTSGIPSGYRSSPPSKHIEPFHYRITRPTSPTGPGDELPLEVSLLLPSSSQPISLSCTLERKLNLYEAAGSPTPPDLFLPSAPSTSTLANYQAAAASSSTSLLSSIPPPSSSSQYPSSSRKRSDSPPAANVLLHNKSITSPIVTGTTSEFDLISPTEAVGRLVLSLPAKPPPSQWPIGESLKTDLAEIKFELRFKITFNTPSGPQEVVLPLDDIRLCPISQEQRSVARDAIAKKKEKLKEKEKLKAKSKSAPNSRRSSPVAERKTLTGKMDVGRTKSSPGTSRTAAGESSKSRGGGEGGRRRGSLTLDRKEKNINRLDLFPPDLDYMSTSGSSRAEPDTPPLLPPQFMVTTRDDSKSSPNASSMDIASYFETHGVANVDGHATPSSALTFTSSSSTSTHETKSHLTVEREGTMAIYATRSGSASTSALSNFPFSTPTERATLFPFSTPGDRTITTAPSSSPVTPTKTKSKEDIGNGWSTSSKLRRLPLLSTYSSSSSSTVKVKSSITTPTRSPLTPPSIQPRASVDQLRIGITTPTRLKLMPTSAVRAWEEELEKITSKSKSSSDNMPRGFSRDRTISNASIHAGQVASTATARGLAPPVDVGIVIGRGSRERSVSQGEGGQQEKAGKVRRSTVNALTAWGIPLSSGSLPTGPPSSFRMGGRSARA